MKIGQLTYTLWIGRGQDNRRAKKLSFLKCITKSKCYYQKNLVFSFSLWFQLIQRIDQLYGKEIFDRMSFEIQYPKYCNAASQWIGSHCFILFRIMAISDVWSSKVWTFLRRKFWKKIENLLPTYLKKLLTNCVRWSLNMTFCPQATRGLSINDIA